MNRRRNGKALYVTKQEAAELLAELNNVSPGEFEIRHVPDSSTFIPPREKFIKIRLKSESYNSVKKVKSTSNIISNRGLKILKYSAQGLTGREISTKLHISLSGIKKEKSFIFDQLGVRNICAAITIARNLGLIP